jgi:hypothetical protein
MHLLRHIQVSPKLSIDLYIRDELLNDIQSLCLHDGVFSGAVTQIHQDIHDGFHTIFNENYHLFILIYKEQERILITAFDKVNYFFQDDKQILSNRKRFKNHHFLSTPKNFIFLRNLYWDEDHMSVELSDQLLLKLRRLSSKGFGEAQLSSIFAKPLFKIKNNFYSLYDKEHHVYIIFQMDNGKIRIHELIQTDFFTSGIETTPN